MVNFYYLIWLSLVSYSLAFAHIESSAPIFRGTRAIAGSLHKSLVECYHCVGFWVSILVHLILFAKPIPYSVYVARQFMVYVLSSAILCLFYDKIVTVLWKVGK